ncbi:uncharacterized protein LOC143368052 isoform X2 [Andrena cerasifolii]|uniref:uncharacterized protein LOC143368052 isoform X2 n=2 Tax=Andrena cerasifolii TaxID=2819439 RepID=UPI004037B3D2
MKIRICESIVKLLMTTFDVANINRPDANQQEEELHDIVADIIRRSVEDTTFSMETDTTLEFHQPFRPHSEEFVDEEALSPEDLLEVFESTQDEEQACVPEEGGLVDLEYKQNAVDYWKGGKKKRLPLESVRQKFRKVKSVSQLYRWEHSLEKGGNRREKLMQISRSVFNQFCASTDVNAIIHDTDLRQWALEANIAVSLKNFKASPMWILNFKRHYNIVSRKINKFITRSYAADAATLENSATEFVNMIKSVIDIVGLEHVYNADESNFNLEIHSGRTLVVEGTKKVETVVQSLSAMTHSYTILPVISAAGKLMSPLLIVLKESSGTFGPQVKKTLFNAPNVHIQASKSGKLSTQLFHEWFTNVYIPNTQTSSALLLDSWTGHCPASMLELVPNNKQVANYTIPKQTTGMIQPLDIYGFRVWKDFVRKFSDTVLLLNIDVNLHLRNNIIKL